MKRLRRVVPLLILGAFVLAFPLHAFVHDTAPAHACVVCRVGKNLVGGPAVAPHTVPLLACAFIATTGSLWALPLLPHPSLARAPPSLA